MIKNETGRLVQLLKRFQGGQAASLDPVTAAASSATVNDSNPDSSLTSHAISDRRVERLASGCDQEHVPRPIADDALLMDLYRVQRVFPVKPTPVLVPRDSGLPLRCEQTLFEGEWITCFVIGGEKRLCLTQFMHSRSLRRFTFSDINKTCAYLNIHCPPCSREQMEALKVRLNESVVLPSLQKFPYPPSCCRGLLSTTAPGNLIDVTVLVIVCEPPFPQGYAPGLLNVLPVTFTNSALITKTDAVRLYGFLCLQSKAPLLDKRKSDSSTTLGGRSGKKGALSFIPVEHDCFGGCRGRFYRDLYDKPTAECVKCDHCGELLTAKAFVSHAHCNFERHVCHWGFNSDNWPSYIHLPLEEQGNTLYAYAMEQLKTSFEEAEKQAALKRGYTELPQESSKKRFCLDTSDMNSEVMRSNLVAIAPSVYYDNVFLKAYASALIANQNFMRSHDSKMGTFTNGEHSAIHTGPSAFTGDCLAVRNGVLPCRPADAYADRRNSVMANVYSRETVNEQTKLLKRKLSSYSEEQSQNVNASEQCSFSSGTIDGKDDLFALLKQYVSDPAGIEKIHAKFLECLSDAETRLRYLEMHNRILLEELFQIENRKQVSNGGILPMAALFNKAYF
ncbi:ski protein like [Trichuris trichiura]|uniref:Ski protein like n=1 Tax=Trichuris trichiura TaxID=36087 RepID=A0A077Z671_TRITR|nr:ski protein like [Trichuris trichiura]